MAHRSSPAGLRAARQVLKHYIVTTKPVERRDSSVPEGLRPDEIHMSIIIDRATNVHELCKIREQIRYWQDRLTAGSPADAGVLAGQLGFFFQRLIDAIEMVPQYGKDEAVAMYLATRPKAGNYPRGVMPPSEDWEPFKLTKAAIEAAKTLYVCYDFESKKVLMFRDPQRDLSDMAKLIHSSLGIAKPLEALQSIRDGKALLARRDIEYIDVRKLVRDIGVYFDQMPHYRDLREESMLLLA